MSSAEVHQAVAAAAHVEPLARRLALLPTSAVPAVVDCVLATAVLSPTDLFFSLLKAFPKLAEDFQTEDGSKLVPAHSSFLISYIAALFHLIKNHEVSADAFTFFIWKCFVPLLGATSPDARDLLNQFEILLCETVTANQSWEIMGSTLVPLCLKSVNVSCGMNQQNDLAVNQWGCIEFGEVGLLPLTVACNLLSCLLDGALKVRGSWAKSISNEVDPAIQNDILDAFIQNLTWDLSFTAVDMLLQSLEHQSCAIRLLFPTIFRISAAFPTFEVSVNGMPQSFHRSSFLKSVWERCIAMFSLGHAERVNACCLLSLYFSIFNSVSMNDSDEGFNIRAENKLWEEIRRGLVNEDASLRKHSLYILKKLLPNSVLTEVNCSSSSNTAITSFETSTCQDKMSSCSGMTKREKWADKEARSMHVGEICTDVNGFDRWRAFFLLYDMLEEYGTHLVEAAWSHQISLFFQPGLFDNTESKAGMGLHQNQMESLDGMLCWLAILWERGLFHENPQVRCLILESFLRVDWNTHNNYVKHVPRSFIIGPLLMSLNDAIHHKDFGIGEVYTSSTIQDAVKFICRYAGELSMSEHLELVCSMASLAREETFGRPGLMAFASFLSSAACRTKAKSLDNCMKQSCEMQMDVHREHLDFKHLNLLDALGVIIERSKQHFNPNYRLQACKKILDVASSLICALCTPLEMVLHFISTFPREFIDFGGALRGRIELWLYGVHNHFTSSDSGPTILSRLLDFPRSFMNHQVSNVTFISFDDEELNAWIFEVQRWVKVLFLVTTEEQKLEPLYKTIQEYSSSISGNESSVGCLSAKYFVLVICLIEELQILFKKCKHSDSYVLDAGTNNASAELIQNASGAFFARFTNLLLSVLDNILSFANSICSVFWSVPQRENADLPFSVKGKLGGPSQRRLPVHLTTGLLEAILSLKAVACITSWTMLIKKDVWLSSSFAFLWNFSWDVISYPTNASEAGAEIHLAAYEALTSVFKALSTAFSPSAVEFVKKCSRSAFPDGQKKPLLDLLFETFLQNINNLLAEGILTRSRRSVLMNWKWLCLDSLLSISYNASKSGDFGAQVNTTYTFLSYSSVGTALSDIVESLENAGETSVLPLLRSLRLVISLLYPSRACTASSLCQGIDTLMMMQLVQSSWILHVSCNKRRIAPIAALLSSVLHPSVFSDVVMHKMICGNEAPLKWFVQKILNEGSKSPRTVRLAALHLTGLWLSYPITIKYYIKELMLLALYGSVAFDEDFEGELSENLDVALEVSALAKFPNSELTEVFINTELYARVTVAVLFDKLADLVDANREQTDNADATSALSAGKMFLLELLDSAVTDKDLAKELYKKYSAVHRRKVRAWQMICVLSRFVEWDIVKQVSYKLHLCLHRNNLPAVRQYLEIFAIQIYLKFPSLVEKELLPIFHDYNVRPQALSSYVFIGANVILHSGELPLKLKHLNVLLPPIIPLLTSHHHSLRGFTQLLVYNILCTLVPVMESNNLEIIPIEKKCFEELKSYLAGNVDCVRLRASMEGFLTSFNPRTASTPIGIFNARNQGSDFECAPLTLMEQVINFLNDVREDLRSSMAKDDMTIKSENFVFTNDWQTENADKSGGSLRMLGETLLDFQKKISLDNNQPLYPGTAEFALQEDFQTFFSEMEKEDQLFSSAFQSRNAALGRFKESRQHFILVASLLDRIPNLAGLARTCEVFRAAALAIADANILHDKQFQLISVTADKWVPIVEVPVCSMKAFLEKKRSEGFSILGLEQTTNSTPLDQYSFPKKTVLVLGREKEGIPVDLIHCLDACLEIPQLGVIRSLNVHVSGAIALWEYTRQQRLKGL